MQSVELGWLCGMIDGEGHVGINHSRTWYTPQIDVVTTNNDGITRLVKCYESLGIVPKLYKQKPTSSKHKILTHVSIRTSKELLPVLSCIKDFCCIKKRQCYLLEEFCIGRATVNYRKSYTDRELEIYSQMCAINKKGP